MGPGESRQDGGARSLYAIPYYERAGPRGHAKGETLRAFVRQALGVQAARSFLWLQEAFFARFDLSWAAGVGRWTALLLLMSGFYTYPCVYRGYSLMHGLVVSLLSGMYTRAVLGL